MVQDFFNYAFYIFADKINYVEEKMHPAKIFCLFLLLFQVPATSTGSDSYLIQTAIANGGIGAILFLIWWLTFKYTQKQFEFALRQNQEQFDKALQQIEFHHRENIEEQRRTNDKLFDVIQKDAEYKEVLTGVLTEIKNKIVKE